MFNAIPELDSPYSTPPEQPEDIRKAPMDSEFVLLRRDQFLRLSEYSASIPSGAYPGKVWKRCVPGPAYPGGDSRQRKPNVWILMWYEAHPTDPNLCSIKSREIRIGTVKPRPTPGYGTNDITDVKQIEAAVEAIRRGSPSFSTTTMKPRESK